MNAVQEEALRANLEGLAKRADFGSQIRMPGEIIEVPPVDVHQQEALDALRMEQAAFLRWIARPTS